LLNSDEFEADGVRLTNERFRYALNARNGIWGIAGRDALPGQEHGATRPISANVFVTLEHFGSFGKNVNDGCGLLPIQKGLPRIAALLLVESRKIEGRL
jgi:hypothetical protein